MKTFIVSLMLATLVTGPAAFAHGVQQQPSLLNALVNVGNHGSIANVAATVGSPHTLADVNASLLGGAVKADVDVGQTSRHGDTLLNLNASVLSGGVGGHDRW